MNLSKRTDHNVQTNGQGFIALARQHLIRIRGRLPLFAEQEKKKDVRWLNKVTMGLSPHHLKGSLPLTIATDEELSLTCCSVTSLEGSSDHDDARRRTTTQQRLLIQDTITMLSSNNLERNRLGLECLAALTERKVCGLQCSLQISHTMVYGQGSHAEELVLVVRSLLLSFICNNHEQEQRRRESTTMMMGGNDFVPIITTRDHDNDIIMIDDTTCTRDDASSTGSWSSLWSDDDDSSEEDDASGLHGRAWGTFHVQGLRLIASAIEQILTSDCHDHSDPAPVPLDFKDSFWQQIIGELCHNVEWCHSTDATAWSLKILRLLHTLEPVIVTPLLRHTLFPYVSHLEIYGRSERLPMMESEASRLMRRMHGMSPITRIEI